MIAANSSQELINQLHRAEEQGEKLIARAKKNRLDKLRQAKEKAEEDLKSFRDELEAKFQQDTGGKAKVDHAAELMESTKTEINGVLKDYEDNKSKSVHFVVSAVLDVSLELNETQKQALKHEIATTDVTSTPALGPKSPAIGAKSPNLAVPGNPTVFARIHTPLDDEAGGGAKADAGSTVFAHDALGAANSAEETVFARIHTPMDDEASASPVKAPAASPVKEVPAINEVTATDGAAASEVKEVPAINVVKPAGNADGGNAETTGQKKNNKKKNKK